MTSSASIESPTPRALTARDFFIATAMAGAAIGVTWNAWLDIFHLGWKDEELSYVLVAPLIIVLLAWARRDQWYKCRLRSGWIGLPIMAAAWLLHWYGDLA